MYKKLLIIFSVTFYVNVGFAFESKNGDIDIRSDSLQIDINKDKAEFIGKVSMRQNNIVINSDRLVLFFKKDKVEKATFLKNVQIHTNDQVAYGDQAEYLQSSSLFKLTGNVRLTQDNANIRGELFTYNINTKEAKIMAKGQEMPDKKSGRVKAKFNINSKKDVGS